MGGRGGGGGAGASGGGGGGGGGGGPGPRRGGSLVNFFTNWGGSNLFHSRPGEGHSFLGKEKITPCRLVESYLLTNTRSV